MTPAILPAGATTTPTRKTYDGLDEAYDHFNKRLFEGRLPACLITVRPHRAAYGYFSSQRFGATADNSEIRDEIALNMKHFHTRTPAQILSTLVHEIVSPRAIPLRQAVPLPVTTIANGPAVDGAHWPDALRHRPAWRQAHRPAHDALTSSTAARSRKPSPRVRSSFRITTGRAKRRSLARSARSSMSVRSARPAPTASRI